MPAASARAAGARADEALAVAPRQRRTFLRRAYEHDARAAAQAGAAARTPAFHLDDAGGGPGAGPAAMGPHPAGAALPGARVGFLERPSAASRRHGCGVPVRPLDG